MSKQKRGMFRRIVDATRKMMGKSITHHYPDPIVRDRFQSPELRRKTSTRYRRKNDGRPLIKRGGLCAPECHPGTITFHDKMVRHFGRARADALGREWQGSNLSASARLLLLPTPKDFVDNPAWAWRS